MSNVNYEINDEPIVLSKCLMDLLLSQPNAGNLISLYCFYYYTAKWQKTNHPKATTDYVAKGLDWSLDSVRKYKSKLIDLKLINDIQRKDENGKIIGHFIKLNFIWSKEKVNQSTIEKEEVITTLPEIQTLVFPEGNTLRTNNKIFVLANNKITPKQFEDFWKIYPKKADQGKAKSSWNKLCNKKDRPEWEVIYNAIKSQKKSERWQDSTFIPLATTWLNQYRWLDDPEEMIIYKRTNITLRPPKVWDGMHYNFDPADGLYKNASGESWNN